MERRSFSIALSLVVGLICAATQATADNKLKKARPTSDDLIFSFTNDVEKNHGWFGIEQLTFNDDTGHLDPKDPVLNSVIPWGVNSQNKVSFLSLACATLVQVQSPKTSSVSSKAQKRLGNPPCEKLVGHRAYVLHMAHWKLEGKTYGLVASDWYVYRPKKGKLVETNFTPSGQDPVLVADNDALVFGIHIFETPIEKAEADRIKLKYTITISKATAQNVQDLSQVVAAITGAKAPAEPEIE